jgi:cytochrome c2
MVWDEETLAGYLADPRGFIRGNRMAFQGLRSEEDIAAVIAYIQATGAE